MVVDRRNQQKGEQEDEDRKTSATFERSGEDMQGGSEAVARGRVAAFFAGKDVFVTGGSGFLGRVLLEKLLREAPDIGTIFLLVRPKKGLNAQQRVEKFTNVALFDVVRRAQPAAMGKLHAVEGDTGLPDLGLSASDRALLEERVAVVFHSAASVRFDDPLQKAVRVNVRSVQLMCELATRMRRLEAFVHVSTAFCNLDQLEIEEKVYPAPGDWRSFIKLVEVNPQHLEFLSQKLVDKLANTYIYTKAMGEQVVKYYSDRLPIGILRPSMVTSSEVEPFPGWMDNFYGPTSFTLAVFVGAIHTGLLLPDAYLDVIPVDYVVGGTVLSAVKLETSRKSNSLPVFNATADGNHLFRLDKLEKIDYDLSVENRFPRAYRSFYIKVQSLFWYRLFIILVDLPLALLLDGLTWLLNYPPSLVKVVRRGIVGTLKTTRFAQRTFKFRNNEFLSLNDCVSPEEKLRFRLSTQGVLWHPYLISLIREWKNYFFREYRINPARVDRQLLIIHFVVSGGLLILLWKSSIIANLIRILLKGLSLIMGFPIIQFIFN